MIRFQCPACQKVLKAEDRGAGTKINCPKCGQRLLVPPPVQVENNTVLARPLPPHPTTELPGSEPQTGSIPPGQLFFGCPGCGRAIPVLPHELSWTIECVECKTSFIPSQLATALPAVFLAPPQASPDTPKTFEQNLMSLGRDEPAQPIGSQLPIKITLSLALTASALTTCSLCLSLCAVDYFPTGFVCVVVAIGVSFVAACGFGGALVMGYDDACPSCGRWWVKTETGRKRGGTSLGYRTVTRTDRHTNWNGKFVGGTERHEQVKVKRSTYHLDYECSACGHRWTGTKVSESQDFDLG